MKLAPELTYGLSATHTTNVGAGELEATASVNYNDEVWFDYRKRVKQNDFHTVNASLSYKPRSDDDLRISLYGTNLTNEAYFATALLGNSSDAPVYSPSRQIGVSVDYGF